MSRISAAETVDVRFPTSQQLDGSDAMNPDPDYSAAYLTLVTDAGDGLVGAGFVFTIGTGNNIAAEAIQTVADALVGESVEDLLADMGSTYRRFVYDSPLLWLGPQKGVVHMAIGAVVNALWDLKAKRAGQPLWQLVSSLSPEELVGLVDFSYLTDALTPDEALEILRDPAMPRPDVITVDALMPRRDGWWMVGMIRADPALEDIPIVMVTASVQPHHRVQAEQAEVDGFIAKPFEPDELLAMVGILAASGRA